MLLHVDYIAARLPASVSVRALAQASDCDCSARAVPPAVAACDTPSAPDDDDASVYCASHVRRLGIITIYVGRRIYLLYIYIYIHVLLLIYTCIFICMYVCIYICLCL